MACCSKAFLLLGLLLAVSSVLNSSQVSARELAEKTQSEEASKGYGYGYGGSYGHGGGYGYGGGGYGHGGHHPPEKNVDLGKSDYYPSRPYGGEYSHHPPGNGYGHGGGYGHGYRYGHGGGYYPPTEEKGN